MVTVKVKVVEVFPPAGGEMGGEGEKLAVTPGGNPKVAKLTLGVALFTDVTVMVAVPVAVPDVGIVIGGANSGETEMTNVLVPETSVKGTPDTGRPPTIASTGTVPAVGIGGVAAPS